MFSYDASGNPLSYYITNLQGDVMDAQGNTVASYDYDPYGNITSTTGSMANVNPLRYRGYYYDSELGMYYLQSRYYDPQIGRFINADGLVSTGQGVLGNNMFAYCGNNPVCRNDCTGLFWNKTKYEVTNAYTSLVSSNKTRSTYVTTITYTITKTSFFGLGKSAKNTYAIAFRYYITSEGVVLFDNHQTGASLIEQSCVRSRLASEMLYTARAAVSGALKGRTAKGLATELLMHYKGTGVIFISGAAEEAFMGSMNKKGNKGHDKNSWLFEVFSCFGV